VRAPFLNHAACVITTSGGFSCPFNNFIRKINKCSPHELSLPSTLRDIGITKFNACAGGTFFWKARLLFGVDTLTDHPPPKPPFQCPYPDKKGTNLFLIKFCIHLHNHQDLKLKCCRVLGQKLRYGRPCTSICVDLGCANPTIYVLATSFAIFLFTRFTYAA